MWISPTMNVTIPVSSIYEFYTSMVGNAMGGTFSDELTQVKIKTRLGNYFGDNIFKVFDANNAKYFGGIDINNREVWVGIAPWVKLDKISIDDENDDKGVLNIPELNCVIIKKLDGDIRDIEFLRKYCVTVYEAIGFLIFNTGFYSNRDLISLYCTAFHLYSKYRISMVNDKELLTYMVRYICSQGMYYSKTVMSEFLVDFCIKDMKDCRVESTMEFPDVYSLLGIDMRSKFYLDEVGANTKTPAYTLKVDKTEEKGDTEVQNDES